jgi:hypothetical protein
VKTIEADLKVRACQQREQACSPPPRRLHHCQRGRSQRPLSLPAIETQVFQR